MLKGLERDGFVFYTNYASRKGRELLANPRCALTFYWAELERQVRVEGAVEKVSKEQSENYFKGRPKGSRIGAVVSNQSAELPSRRPLETRLAELELAYANTDDVPMPETWGGYYLAPHLWNSGRGAPTGCTTALCITSTLTELGAWGGSRRELRVSYLKSLRSIESAIAL